MNHVNHVNPVQDGFASLPAGEDLRAATGRFGRGAHADDRGVQAAQDVREQARAGLSRWYGNENPANDWSVVGRVAGGVG